MSSEVPEPESQTSVTWSFEHVTLVISSRGQPQENRILNFVKIRKKKLRFIQIEIFFVKCRIR